MYFSRLVIWLDNCFEFSFSCGCVSFHERFNNGKASLWILMDVVMMRSIETIGLLALLLISSRLQGKGL
ncbi:MAG: hypothetical protein DRQ52_04205 [Gammaproteobacteria bacterium]|nr:MAG: hypothetical protein DRQ52_04205 [Gammaproteobacteria bacterium]